MMKHILRYFIMVIIFASGDNITSVKAQPIQHKTIKLDEIMGEDKQYQTKIAFLGTGTPILEKNIAGQAIAIIVQDQVYMFDVGPGSMSNVINFDNREAFPPDRTPMGNMNVGYMDKLFLTHLDSDHTLDINEFILRFWTQGRDKPIQIYGPVGTKNLAGHTLIANKTWIDYRLTGERTKNSEGYKVNVTEFSKPGLVFKDNFITIQSFSVVHGTWDKDKTFGYLIKTPDLSIAITGDYSYRLTPSLQDILVGNDIIISTIMSQRGLEKLSPVWKEYMLNAHTTEKELAQLATQVKPKLLIATHVITQGLTRQELVNDMKSVYKGNFIMAEDNLLLK